MARLPQIEPMPAVAGGRLPWLRSGPALLREGAEFFARTRARLGDTFVVDAFGYRLFCVFSPEGVRALYALPERQASFGLATYELVMRHKLPLPLVVGRRTRPHDLFGSQEVEGYLEQLEQAVSRQQAELGGAGRFELFAFARRLGHRLGLACWAGAEAASPPALDRLIPLFDRLDTSASFVQPAQAFVAHATRKWRERRAMQGIERVLGEILAARRGRPPRGDFLEQIDAAWASEPDAARAQGVARDVMLIHMGAQSNLYAALAWTLVDLLLRPALLAQVAAGDDALLERCASESIRMAQRSLTLRRVMQPLELALEDGRYRLAPGTLLATMLAATNQSAAPGLERFDPAHYEGRRLARQIELPARELVSTFGHGRHACPAQRFSISAIRIAVRRLLERYALTPHFGAEPELLFDARCVSASRYIYLFPLYGRYAGVRERQREFVEEVKRARPALIADLPNRMTLGGALAHWLARYTAAGYRAHAVVVWDAASRGRLVRLPPGAAPRSVAPDGEVWATLWVRSDVAPEPAPQ